MNQHDELTKLDLKPCPFCGKPDRKDVVHTEDYYAFVVCRHCGCHGPAVAMFEIEGSTRMEAIVRWNERTTQ